METEVLRWVWLVAGVALLAGEIATTGLFLLPFSAGAFAAAIAAFLGVAVGGQVIVCFVVAAIAFAALRPLAHRLDRTGKTEGIGSRRLVNEPAIVLAAIPDHDLGMIRVGREEWRAQSVDGRPIAKGAKVRILDIRGTRALVTPFEAPPHPDPLPD